MSGMLHNELKDAVVRLTLDHAARRNALSFSLLRGLSTAFPAAAGDGARVAVLSGAGGVFSAGADLADIVGTSADSAYDRELENVGAAIRAFPGPVIAVIEGACMGAAVDLALACDIRICGEGAFFEVPAIRLGLLYNPRAIARLHRRLSSQTLARIFLLGQRLPAAAAQDAGIVAQVFALDELDAAADRMARHAAGASPGAAALTKELLVALDDDDVDMAAWEAAQLKNLDSPDRRAATAAAKERLGLGAAQAKPDVGLTGLRGSK